MVRGYPDYARAVGLTKEGELLTQFADPPVWFEETFSEPHVKWYVEDGSAQVYVGESGATAATQYFDGAGCLKLWSIAGFQSYVQRPIGALPTNTRIGVALRFCMDDVTAFQDYAGGLQLIVIDESNSSRRLRIIIAYNPRDYKWYLYDFDTTSYTEIGTLRLAQGAIHYIKLIFDVVTSKYVKLVVNGDEFDLTAYSLYTTTAAVAKVCTLEVFSDWDTGKTGNLYIDSIRITFNER